MAELHPTNRRIRSVVGRDAKAVRMAGSAQSKKDTIGARPPPPETGPGPSSLPLKPSEHHPRQWSRRPQRSERDSDPDHPPPAEAVFISSGDGEAPPAGRSREHQQRKRPTERPWSQRREDGTP